MTQDPGSNRRAPLGGRTGVTLVALTPIVAVIIYVLLGFAFGAWAWAWVVFLMIPIVYLVVYGPGKRPTD